MGADNLESGARAGHDDLGRAAAALDRQASGLGQIDADRPSNAIIAGRKVDQPFAILEAMFDGRSIVDLAVAFGAEITYIAHGSGLK